MSYMRDVQGPGAVSTEVVDVAVFEREQSAHTGGSSHGSARIVRRAYADDLYGAGSTVAEEVGLDEPPGWMARSEIVTESTRKVR